MQRRDIHRYATNLGLMAAADLVAPEEPLEIQVDTRPIAITMRTPGHDADLALGFLVSEGLIQLPSQVAEVKTNPRNATGNSLGVYLSANVTVDYARLTRHVFGSSSCGICGKSSIDAVRVEFPSVEGQMYSVAPEELLSWPAQMQAAQPTFAATGGLHAAALFSVSGEMRLLREDVGRHNAVDKIVGHAFRHGWLPLVQHALLVSGRSSFEIQQKALAAGIAFVAAVGAPSSLAVDFARETGQTLVGFLRPGRFNIYSGHQRLEAVSVADRPQTPT